jgi:hypothetical protein
MFEILRTERFNMLASCLLGIAIIAIFKTPCRDNCTLQKAPSQDEIATTAYQIRSKCYTFKPTDTECPQSGVIGI